MISGAATLLRRRAFVKYMSGLGTPPLPLPSIVGRALLVSNDSTVVGQLTNGMRQFAIAAEICTDLATAVSLINTRKFEAIVVDLTFGEPAIVVLERVRLSPSNLNSVTFALVDSWRAESRVQPNFVMQKPLTDSLVGNTLKAALGLIIRDYRRYFRCSVAVPATIQIGSTAELTCEIINISEGGLAVNTLATLRPGVVVTVQFTLPGEPTTFNIEAEICWSDNKVRAGLHFRSVSMEQRLLLHGWLSREIERGLPDSIARLFQKPK
jgi:hypothetical protein